ncbi:cache domain-containing sensor histidine kinase [Paenibacillus oleatilyticus]|uniref:cache domain-containing sensor histidine kinase n=1 Tax=Paenibacillus oleatilyticus TaxID=2594886 RepID=UPI001C1FEEFE|nr:sensor histidine kinase [Paenibacillus oleatilyticus]MBU7314492.1 sensor histidine kinase [Paenibacillus oleatilyticus]
METGLGTKYDPLERGCETIDVRHWDKLRWAARIHPYLRRSKIKNRLILSFLFLSILPLCIATLLTYNKSGEAIRSKISAYSLQILDQLRNEIKRENELLLYLTDQIMMHNLVQTSLLQANTALDTQSVMDSYYELNSAFSGRKLFSQIKSLQITNSSGNLMYDLGYDKLRDEDIAMLTDMIEAGDGKDVWTHIVTKNGVDCIVLARPIHSQFDWMNTIGYVFIAVKESYYSRIIHEDADVGEGSDLFIADTRGVVLSAGNRSLQVGANYPNSELLKEISEHELLGTRAFSAVFNKQKYLLVYSYDAVSRWYLVGTIPYELLNKETKQILPYIVLVVGLCLLCSLLLAFLISTSISTPLQRLTESMKQVSTGNFQVRIQDPGNDEIGFLTGKFNLMIEQLRDLIDHTKQEQIKKREIELQMLQAQINPHFLFNTLNCLKWTAAINHVPVVSDGLTALAELLRHTMVDKKEFIPLRSELANVDNYLIIQRLRFGSSFTVEYDIDDGLSEAAIMKFILQPIVENSLIHGLDGAEREEKKLVISATSADGQLLIAVQDNGKGMDEEQLRRLLDSNYRGKHRLSNIGIRNVQERIQLNFGTKYGLSVESREGEGTRVLLTMPMIGGNQE